MGDLFDDRQPLARPRSGQASSVYGRAAPIMREHFCSRAAVRSAVWTALLTCLLGGAGEHGGRVVDIESLDRAARAERLVGDTIAALAAYSYDAVAGLHGCQLHEREQANSSEFQVELAVTPTSAGSLRIEGVLLETRSRRTVSQFVTYRGRT